jgi:uncharacterized protein YecA (UPF0149 family)
MNQFREMRQYLKSLDTMSHEQLKEEIRKSLAEIKKALNPGRNEPCHCESGKKFKRCCG